MYSNRMPIPEGTSLEEQSEAYYPTAVFSFMLGEFECYTARLSVTDFLPTHRASYSWILRKGEKDVAWSRCGLEYFCRRVFAPRLSEDAVPSEYKQSPYHLLNAARYLTEKLGPSWYAHVKFCCDVATEHRQWIAKVRLDDENDPQGWVYLVGAEHPGHPVKIGFTRAQTPQRRLPGLQTGCPYKLKVLESFRGRHSDEQKAHALLDAHRLCGEWFEDCQEVRDGYAQTAAERAAKPMACLPSFPRARLSLP